MEHRGPSRIRATDVRGIALRIASKDLPIGRRVTTSNLMLVAGFDVSLVPMRLCYGLVGSNSLESGQKVVLAISCTSSSSLTLAHLMPKSIQISK